MNTCCGGEKYGANDPIHGGVQVGVGAQLSVKLYTRGKQ